MASEEEKRSILNRVVSNKPRGLKPYLKKVRLPSESAFHTVPRNEKARPCMSERKSSRVCRSVDLSSSGSSVSSQLPGPATVTPITSEAADITCREVTPQPVEQLQSATVSHVVSSLDQQEHYFHLLKIHNSISLYGECGHVLIIKDYQSIKKKLHPDKYMLVQRRCVSFLHEECQWIYWCNCNDHVSRQLSSLDSNINMTVMEFQDLYPDCIHLKVAKLVYDRYDTDNDIEPVDVNLQEGGDHSYYAADEFYEVPDARLILCKSAFSARYGLVNYKLDCISCLKVCDHSKICKQLIAAGGDSPFIEVIQNVLDDGTDVDKTNAHSVYKKKVISFKRIPYSRSQSLTDGLRNLGQDIEDNLLPDLEICNSCGGGLQSGDPVSAGWLAYDRALVVTNTTTKYVKVYYRPCQSCDAISVFEGQSKCLLNLGTYLVGYDVLRSYMHSFLHGRRPLHTFYQTWCDVHLDYGNSQIQEDFSYHKFLHAWHTFLGMLDIDFTQGFSCPDCGGDDGQPETIICDGTSLAFQKRMWQWTENDPDASVKNLTSARFSDRVFLKEATTRQLLKRYVVTGQSTGTRGLRLKPLDPAEKKKLMSSLAAVSKPLYNIMNEIEGDPFLLPVYRKLLFSLASPSPVSSLIRPTGNVEPLVQSIISGLNVKEEPSVWKNIHCFMPVFFEIFEKHEISDNMRLLTGELWNISVSVVATAKEDEVYVENSAHHADDELSFFPSLPKYRRRGRFNIDSFKDKSKDNCSKKYGGHPSLLPGVFTLFCPHGICYGFQVMASNESPNVPFTILRTRFRKPPKHIIYDNACRLHMYCMSRDPVFFKDSEFYVDRLHWYNHTSCSYGYELSLYPQFEKLNSQCNEQANAGLKRIKDQLSYMTASNFMSHCAFYLRHQNLCKLKNAFRTDSVEIEEVVLKNHKSALPSF